MKLTIYDRQLITSIDRLWPGLDTASLVERLICIGVVDPVKCKVLVVREHVDELVSQGHGKVDSMYMAAEKFCCSYEYVRKCVYYYKNINLQ